MAQPLWMGQVELTVVTVPAKAHTALVALRVFPGALVVRDGRGEVREWWGAGDRAGGSERGGAPGGAAVPLHG
jgi:hypothetical protein